METIVLVIHLILALTIIALVLLQRSEGGGLGIGGGGMGGFASARGTANALTRMTAICALGFFITSLTLGVMASRGRVDTTGILADVSAKDVPIQAPVAGSEPGIEYMPPEATHESETAAEEKSDVQSGEAVQTPSEKVLKSAPAEAVPPPSETQGEENQAGEVSSEPEIKANPPAE